MSKNKNLQTQILKQPYAEFKPNKAKTPRVIDTPNEECRPVFRGDLMDLSGPWKWDLSDLEIQEYTQNLLSWGILCWRELRERKCHLIKISKIIRKAQKRLRELEQQDLDELYSLRLSGKKRIYAIKDHNILWLLWWDRFHAIYPCNK